MNMASSYFPKLGIFGIWGFPLVEMSVSSVLIYLLLYFRDFLGARVKSARQPSPPPQRATGKLRVSKSGS